MTDIMFTCQCGVERLDEQFHKPGIATQCECPECQTRYAICYSPEAARDISGVDFIEDCPECMSKVFTLDDYSPTNNHVIAACADCGLTGEVWFTDSS